LAGWSCPPSRSSGEDSSSSDHSSVFSADRQWVFVRFLRGARRAPRPVSPACDRPWRGICIGPRLGLGCWIGRDDRRRLIFGDGCRSTDGWASETLPWVKWRMQRWPRGSNMTLADTEGGKPALSTIDRDISSDAGSGYGGATPVYVRNSGRSPCFLALEAKLTYVAILPALILRSCNAARLEYWAAGPFGRVEACGRSDWLDDQYTRLLAESTATHPLPSHLALHGGVVLGISSPAVPECGAHSERIHRVPGRQEVEALRALDGCVRLSLQIAGARAARTHDASFCRGPSGLQVALPHLTRRYDGTDPPKSKVGSCQEGGNPLATSCSRVYRTALYL
jgi:hypothetical protein